MLCALLSLAFRPSALIVFQTVYDFVKNQFKTFLGVEPQIFPVSAKRALSAKTCARTASSSPSLTRFSPRGPLQPALGFLPVRPP